MQKETLRLPAIKVYIKMETGAFRGIHFEHFFSFKNFIQMMLAGDTFHA